MAAARLEKERERSAANAAGSKPRVASIDKGARRALDETKAVHARFWKSIRSQIVEQVAVVSSQAKKAGDDAAAAIALVEDVDDIDFLDASLGVRMSSMDISTKYGGGKGGNAPEDWHLPSSEDAHYKTPPATERHQSRLENRADSHANAGGVQAYHPRVGAASEEEPRARDLPTPGEGRLTRSAARKSNSMRSADVATAEVAAHTVLAPGGAPDPMSMVAPSHPPVAEPIPSMWPEPAAAPSGASVVELDRTFATTIVAGVACGAGGVLPLMQAIAVDDENDAPQTRMLSVTHAVPLPAFVIP